MIIYKILKYMRFIIYNPASELFIFFEEALSHELLKRDIETVNYKNINTNTNTNTNTEPVNPSQDIILIIVNPHYIYDYPEIKNTISLISKTYKYKIFYLTEPINFILEKRVFTELINIIKPYALWTYTSSNFKKLNIYQPIFKVFPHYNETLDLANINLTNLKARNAKTIVFFGNINDVRKPICDQFKTVLRNETNAWSKAEHSVILNEYLFYLNIHRRDKCQSFETFRIIPILANGGVIFSESCNESEEDIYRKYNIVFCKKTELYNTFLQFIENIDYNTVFNKAQLFRTDMLNQSVNLDDFFHYHYKLQ